MAIVKVRKRFIEKTWIAQSLFPNKDYTCNTGNPIDAVEEVGQIILRYASIVGWTKDDIKASVRHFLPLQTRDTQVHLHKGIVRSSCQFNNRSLITICFNDLVSPQSVD